MKPSTTNWTPRSEAPVPQPLGETPTYGRLPDPLFGEPLPRLVPPASRPSAPPWADHPPPLPEPPSPAPQPEPVPDQTARYFRRYDVPPEDAARARAEPPEIPEHEPPSPALEPEPVPDQTARYYRRYDVPPEDAAKRSEAKPETEPTVVPEPEPYEEVEPDTDLEEIEPTNAPLARRVPGQMPDADDAPPRPTGPRRGRKKATRPRFEGMLALRGKRRYKGSMLFNMSGKDHKEKGQLVLAEGTLIFLNGKGRMVQVPLDGIWAASCRDARHPKSWNEPTYKFKWGSRGWGWYQTYSLNWWTTGMLFRHRDRPRYAFHTNDLRITRDPEWNALPASHARVLAARPWFPRTRRLLFHSLWVLLLAFIFLPAFRTAVSRRVVSQIPLETERELGDSVYSSLRDRGLRVIKDPALSAEMDLLIKPLLEHLPPEARLHPLEIEIGHSPEVNAFALPGGKIVVYAGLLLEASSPEEVAGVIAHEIAHVAHRHSLRQYVEALGVRIFLLTITGGDEQALTEWALRRGADLAELKFSREDEREADEAAWAYLEEARINPSGFRNFFVRMVGTEEIRGLAILSTHPETLDRVAYLNEKQLALPPDEYRFIDLHWPDVQARVRGLLGEAPVARESASR